MKKYYVLVWAIVALFFIRSCVNDNISEDKEIKQKNIEKLNSINSARLQLAPLTTNGGNLSLTSNQINQLYQLTGSSQIETLRNLVLYSKGNEDGSTEVNISNVLGISIFQYVGINLQHQFFQNIDGSFQVIPELTSSSFGVTEDETNFAVLVSEIYRNNSITTYNVLNHSVYDSKPKSLINNVMIDFTPSYQLLDKRAVYIASRLKLSQNPNLSDDFTGVSRALSVPCRKCGQVNATGSCEVDLSNNSCVDRDTQSPENPNGNEFEDPPMCPRYGASSTLGSSYSNYFDNSKMYGFRDNVLERSNVGMKYYMFYYQTSFYKVEYDFADALKIAFALPDIYNLYDNIMNNNTNAYIFDDTAVNKLTEILDILISKNSQNENLVSIFNFVKEDVAFLKNRKIGELEQIVY